MVTLKTVPISDPDRKQTIVVLPAEFAQKFPPDFVAQYLPESDNILKLTMVDPTHVTSGRTYSVVRHHGAAQLSVPRTWLRDQHVIGDGRQLQVAYDEQQPSCVFLSVVAQ